MARCQHLQYVSKPIGTCLAAVFIAFFTVLATATEQNQNKTKTIEQTNQPTGSHLGVASCSESTCHGSNVIFKDSSINRNEFRVWNEFDPHSQAYATLLTPRSIKIARNLDIGPAQEANECLGCHANNIASENRGEGFDINEGVNCESCHGAGSTYLKEHTSGNYQSSLKAGLYPTANPHKRANLCISCHVGNSDDRKITHSIMGAGHPRLSFELNTFSSIQPAHYRQDEDYRSRKGDITDLQVWAVGQLVAAQQFLNNIKDHPSTGLFPELVHMDCHSCHESMSNVNWSLDPLAPLLPGELRYNDAYLSMSYQLAKAILPDTANRMLPNLRRLLSEAPLRTKRGHKAITQLHTNIKELLEHISRQSLSTKQGTTLIKTFVEIGLISSHKDYASAEQTAMAINSVLVASFQDTSTSDSRITAQRTAMMKGVNRLFSSLDKAENYQQKQFIKGLQQINEALAN